MSNVELLPRVVREQLGPLVAADGGELYLVSVSDNELVLHLGGRFAGCPGNTLARRHVIEPLLQQAAPEVTLVITSGALIPPGATRVA